MIRHSEAADFFDAEWRVYGNVDGNEVTSADKLARAAKENAGAAL
jgi:hypothetical protein